MTSENGGPQQLFSYLGRAALWRDIREKLKATGARLAPADLKALNDLCAGVTWMQRVPPALLASYRALYIILRGNAAEEEEEINRDILRTVRAETGLLLDFTQDQRDDFAGAIRRVLNALALVDGMGYCQGQNYVVDVMLKAGLPERETFCLFLYLLRQGHLHGIYRKEVPMLASYMDKFEEQLQLRLPNLAAHFETEHYPPPLYALEWMTTLFGLAARPLISLVALDLFLAGACNAVIRLCISLLGIMEQNLLQLDQEGMLREFRSRAVAVDAEEAIVRALSEGGSPEAADTIRSRVGANRLLGWSTGPDYLLVLRARHCQTVGLYELREDARNALLVGNSTLQDALLAVTRSLGWGRLRTCWLESCLGAKSDHERHQLANESLRFVIANGGHVKAAAFMLGLGGADANGVDARLLSPLHVAALFNRPDIARLLLMCGASPDLVGGVTRVAASKGAKLWSPVEMAEAACAEGGELDEAGVAVGPAALFVLRGLVCLQCNAKLSKPAPCELCSRSFCKACMASMATHFCVGRLDLPKGVAESVRVCGDGGEGGSHYGTSSFTGNSFLPSTKSIGRLQLGSAIGDRWETVFDERISGGVGHARSNGFRKPARLERGDPVGSKAGTDSEVGEGDTDADGHVPPAWSTLHSVLLGTWERRPLMTSPKDRNKMLDNAAAFVRACFPGQTWLQRHMEEDMGLCLGSAGVGQSWGGPVKDMGMRGEHFNPDTLQASSSGELHRRMGWVMAEAGVPWENGDQTWCCPECFIIFGLNVFKHYCRGCGSVYCSAHAPPTPVSSTGRSLKLCWSCVLEGAVPLPSLADELARNAEPLSPVTARGYAHHLTSSPSSGSGSGSRSGSLRTTRVPPRGGLGQELLPEEVPSESDSGGSNGGSFLSSLASLIEAVATPTSPRRSRADVARAREKRRMTGAEVPREARGEKEVNKERDDREADLALFEEPTTLSPPPVPRCFNPRSPMRSPRGEEIVPPRSPTLFASPASGTSNSTTTSSCTELRSSPLSESSNESVPERRGLVVLQYGPSPGATLNRDSPPPSMNPQSESYSPPDPNRPVPQRGFGRSRSPSPVRVIPQRGFGARARTTSDLSKVKLQRGLSSSMSTVSSNDTGDEDDAPLHRGFGPSRTMRKGVPAEVPLKRGFGRR